MCFGVSGFGGLGDLWFGVLVFWCSWLLGFGVFRIFGFGGCGFEVEVSKFSGFGTLTQLCWHTYIFCSETSTYHIDPQQCHLHTPLYLGKDKNNKKETGVVLTMAALWENMLNI